jgi:hypothetical protein
MKNREREEERERERKRDRQREREVRERVFSIQAFLLFQITPSYSMLACSARSTWPRLFEPNI